MEKDAYHVIARSAFGKLHLWGETTGDSLFISAPGAYCIPSESILVGKKMNFGVQVFFGGMSRQLNDFDGMFAKAIKKLGRLTDDEMYGFLPALTFGGTATLDYLQKVKVVEHLVILAQCSQLDVITSPPL